jgi:hypothetical protein
MTTPLEAVLHLETQRTAGKGLSTRQRDRTCRWAISSDVIVPLELGCGLRSAMTLHIASLAV